MDWHRQFGLLLTDFFTGLPFIVEQEKDLSLKSQLLDVVIVRRRKGRLTERLPDGLDDLADHNLITFKSHQETLDDWALKELTGHYVNYRKQLSPGDQPLLPESRFRLYAVCSRFPRKLAEEVPWEELQTGVYACRRGTDRIRVVVAGRAREHRVPLSDGALAILETLSPLRTSGFVFPSPRYARPLSHVAMAKVLTRLGAERVTVHGFRSAFRDWAGNETHFAREVAEAALAHAIGDNAEQAYRRSDALESAGLS